MAPGHPCRSGTCSSFAVCHEPVVMASCRWLKVFKCDANRVWQLLADNSDGYLDIPASTHVVDECGNNTERMWSCEACANKAKPRPCGWDTSSGGPVVTDVVGATARIPPNSNHQARGGDNLCELPTAARTVARAAELGQNTKRGLSERDAAIAERYTSVGERAGCGSAPRP